MILSILYTLCVCLALFYFSFYVYIINNKIEYLSRINTLCYSWISFNNYVIMKSLCNINCSYKRIKPFPLNTALSCSNTNTKQNKNINTSYKIYLFNTTTYGKYIESYRFFYNTYYVYNSI